MIHSRIEWLDEEFYDHVINFQNAFYKVDKIRPQSSVLSRKLPCKDRVIEYLPNAVDIIFYEKGLDTQAHKSIEYMIVGLKDAMERHIQQSSWLKTDEDQKPLLEKIKKLKIEISSSSVCQPYQFKLDPDNYYTNLQTILPYTFNQKMRKIGQFKKIDIAIGDDNLCYVAEQNKIVLSLAYFFSPFYDKNVDPARNFGTIGQMIGHKILHGFDYHKLIQTNENQLSNKDARDERC